MLLSVYRYLLTAYFICHIQQSYSHYVGWVNDRMRNKMYTMDRELIRDSMQKIRSIQFMKSYYTKSPSYHLSERIFYIRRKFARMLRLYILANEKFETVYYWEFEFFVKTMVEVQQLGMDIDHLVEMLTDWESDSAKNVINIAGFSLSTNVLKSLGNKVPGMEGIIGGGGLPFPGVAPGTGVAPGIGGTPGVGGAPAPPGPPGPSGIPGIGGAPRPNNFLGPGDATGPGNVPGPGSKSIPEPGGPLTHGDWPGYGKQPGFHGAPGSGRIPAPAHPAGRGRAPGPTSLLKRNSASAWW